MTVGFPSFHSSLACSNGNLDRQVPSEEDGLGHGPVALHSPLPSQDNLPESISIDTEIPATRPKRKRSKTCCVCCGLKYVLTHFDQTEAYS